MRNKHFILFWLCLAFSVVLGHSIIPHHHHDDLEAMEHHDGEHHDDDENGIAGFFSHFSHTSHINISIIQITSREDVIYKTKWNAQTFFAVLPSQFSLLEIIPGVHHPPDLPDAHTTLIFPFARSSRAPPVC
ncbi:hypothetical protein BH09BAC5_BH09BAC5_13920 [soil metagenome]